MSYSVDIIGEGDKASKNLSTLLEDTKSFCGEDIRKFEHGGSALHLLFAPARFDIVGIPVVGDREVVDPYRSALRFVQLAYKRAAELGVDPVGFTDILTMPKFDQEVVAQAKRGLFDGAKHYRLCVLNGESAGHGNRVTQPLNISGLVLGYIKAGKWSHGVHSTPEFQFAVMPHQGRGIAANCDGDGTKPEFAERLHSIGLPFAEGLIQDCEAMVKDDAMKFHGRILMEGHVLEMDGYDPRIAGAVLRANDALTRRRKIPHFLAIENVDTRISGYGSCAMDFSGTAISTFDEETIKSLPEAESGDVFYGLYNPASLNIRCNGVTGKREALIGWRGYDWHMSPEGLIVLNYVSTPSTVYYDAIDEGLERRIIKQAGHSSGGGMNGKWAMPLVRRGLGAELEVEGHTQEMQEWFVRLQGKSLQEYCAEQPYRFDAWAVTDKPKEFEQLAKKHGYVAVRLGVVRKMEKPELSMTFKDRGETVRYPEYQKSA